MTVGRTILPVGGLGRIKGLSVTSEHSSAAESYCRDADSTVLSHLYHQKEPSKTMG